MLIASNPLTMDSQRDDRPNETSSPTPARGAAGHGLTTDTGQPAERDQEPGRQPSKARPSRRSAGVAVVGLTLVLGAVGWLFGWFAAPLQGHGNAWGYGSETETEATHVVGWFLPRPSTQITLTDAWLEGTDDIELVSVRAARVSDDRPEIGSASADDPKLDRHELRPLAGTVIGPTSADEPNDWYVLFEVQWSPDDANDFAIAGPMHLSYRSGLRRLEYHECGFITYSTPQAQQDADEAVEAANAGCTGR